MCSKIVYGRREDFILKRFVSIMKRKF